MPTASGRKTPQPASPTRSTRQLFAASSILLVLVICAGLILWVTAGFLNKGFGVAFLICVALISGIAFWAFAPSHDRGNTFAQLGTRLAGGAAVGAFFAFGAWKLVSEAPSYTVVQVPPDVKPDGLQARPGPGVRDAEILLGKNRALLYVIFDEHAKNGTVTLQWFDISSETGKVRRQIVVNRQGGIDG